MKYREVLSVFVLTHLLQITQGNCTITRETRKHIEDLKKIRDKQYDSIKTTTSRIPISECLQNID